MEGRGLYQIYRLYQKPHTVNQGGRIFVLRADRNLYARLLVIGQSRQIDIRDLLTHALGPVPWFLATYDGSLAKTTKSALAKLLEDDVEILPNLPNASAVIEMPWHYCKPYLEYQIVSLSLRILCSVQESSRRENQLCSTPVPKRLYKEH